MRIQDAALVAAAVLSDRYVTGRFLPDKAIDLVDEAASRLRIEIDSMPTEIDVVARRVRQLEIERVALQKETDAASVERLARLGDRAGDLREQQTAMTAHWQSEKDAIAAIRQLKGGPRGRAAGSRAQRACRRPRPGLGDPLRPRPTTSTGASRRRPTSSPGSSPSRRC